MWYIRKMLNIYLKSEISGGDFWFFIFLSSFYLLQPQTEYMFVLENIFAIILKLERFYKMIPPVAFLATVCTFWGNFQSFLHA